MTNLAETGHQAPKMLIADDDPAIVKLLADRCAKMGFAVETATNGMQLLIKARRNHPDVMIIDVNMPELDGLSVCTRLLDPGSKPVEVVVVTGSADPQTAERCESLGLFYGRKGPEFWKSVEAALAEIYPAMADRIAGGDIEPSGEDIPERPRVLVVDDDPDMGRFLASRLGKHGVDTLLASDAVHGFHVACKERPCVIITDNFMPNGDARYLLYRLRGTAATENIPVFVLSGRVIDEATEQILRREICGRPGAAQVFRKSFDTDELFGALQKFCGFDNNRA
jgi:CheY-like chemotaxis protein